MLGRGERKWKGRVSGTRERKGKGSWGKGEGGTIDCHAVDNGHVLYIVLCGELQDRVKTRESVAATNHVLFPILVHILSNMIKRQNILIA